MSEIVKVVPMPVSDEKIGELREAFSSLSADTSVGYKEVKKAIQVCVKTRTSIDKKRQELNEEALLWQRTVNAEAKRLTGLVEAIEDPLRAKKQVADDEAERIKKEYEAKHQTWLQGRLNECLQVTGSPCSIDFAETASDDQWKALLAEGALALQARVMEDAKRRAIEESERQKMAEEIEAMRMKIESERLEAKRLQEELDQLRREKAEREQAERERLEAIERERLAEQERLEREANENQRQGAITSIVNQREAFELAFDAALAALGKIDRVAYRVTIGTYLDSAYWAVCDALDRLKEYEVPF